MGEIISDKASNKLGQTALTKKTSLGTPPEPAALSDESLLFAALSSANGNSGPASPVKVRSNGVENQSVTRVEEDENRWLIRSPSRPREAELGSVLSSL